MPKLSKAELEAQLVKLERAVSRLREQNKELKRLVREGAEAAELAAAAPTLSRSRTRVAAPKTPQAKPSEPVPHDDSATVRKPMLRITRQPHEPAWVDRPEPQAAPAAA